MVLEMNVKVGKIEDVCWDVVSKDDVVEFDVDELCFFRSDVVDDLLLHVYLRDADEVVVNDEQDDVDVRFDVVDVEVGFVVLRMKL